MRQGPPQGKPTFGHWLGGIFIDEILWTQSLRLRPEYVMATIPQTETDPCGP